MKNKFILNFTPTGMIPTKQMTPHVPVEPEEIVQQVLEADSLGANMVHIHARDPGGKPTYEGKVYEEIIKKIRARTNIIICVSTSGRDWQEIDKRSECLLLSGDTKPDLGSLTLSSLNFNRQASINAPDIIKELAKIMLDNGIKPELEAFDLGMINYGKYLIKKGLLKPPYYFNLILGNIACAQADMMHLGLMINELPDNSIWAAGGVGNPQLKVNSMALIGGGGVRIGLEDNIWYDQDRTKLATNKALIERLLMISDALGMEPYTNKEVRELLDL